MKGDDAVGAEETAEEDYGISLGWDSAEKALRGASVATISGRLPALLRDAFALAWRVDRPAVIVLLVCQAATGTLQAAGLLATTRAIGVLIGPGAITVRLHVALPALLVLGGAGTARALLGVTVAALSRRVAPQLSAEAESMLLTATYSAELVAFDHAGFGDRLDAAERGAVEASELVSGTQDLIAAAASLVAASLVVTVLHPLLLPLLALGIVPRWISLVRSLHIEYTSYQATTADRRMMGALRWYLTDKYPADQIRAGTMVGHLMERYLHHADRVRASERAAAWRSAKVAAVGSAVSGLTTLLLWAGLVALLIGHQISVARAGAAVIALQSVSTALWGMVVAASRLYRTGAYLADWRSFLNEVGGHRLARGSSVPGDTQMFRAEGVSFSYPGSDGPALSDVDFEVRRGEIVGLVGMNGSGKTTLSKLLSGLLLAADGRITWDGVDVRELEPEALWKQVSYVPQQYARFPLTLEANITLGQPHGGTDDVVEAARAAGADMVIAKLKHGLQTMMARVFWGGSDLSGGEWQRVALSRAFYRRGRLLVMDEPTSALDAQGEHTIITGLRRQSRGRATVLVTHRLSCLRYLDRVVVLKAGQVIEQGTLDELLAIPDGELAKLWALQQSDDRDPAVAPPGERAAEQADCGETEGAASLTGYLAAHPAPLMAADALILDEQGRVLLVDPVYKEGWDLPGGMIEDEAPADGVLRELQEELGIAADLGRLLTVDTVPKDVYGRTLLALVYAARPKEAVDPAALPLQRSEVRAAGFFPPEEALEMVPEYLARRLKATLDATRGSHVAVLTHGRTQPASGPANRGRPCS
ncbi:ATP-binding cassette domain-containing protein [Peterkaempfera sp. SMS 1(5)a]|uniref:ATP-binding cassette domain-containing protein n=1 Tax=Peterkaempfera podocarpi TaxID=3232308 RepID=UPI00366DECD8